MVQRGIAGVSTHTSLVTPGRNAASTGTTNSMHETLTLRSRPSVAAVLDATLVTAQGSLRCGHAEDLD